MRDVGLLFVVLVVSAMWCVSPVFGQEAKPEDDYSKVKRLLSDARSAAKAGGEASALEKYGEALIILNQIGRKSPSWKTNEVQASLSEAEAGYIRTLTGIVVKLQNVTTQRKDIVKQQGEAIKKIDTLVDKNEKVMKFLLENRDLIEKIEGSLGG